MFYTNCPKTISIEMRVPLVVFNKVIDIISFLNVSISTDEDDTDMLTTIESGITGVGCSINDST